MREAARRSRRLADKGRAALSEGEGEVMGKKKKNKGKSRKDKAQKQPQVTGKRGK